MSVSPSKSNVRSAMGRVSFLAALIMSYSLENGLLWILEIRFLPALRTSS